MMTEKIELPGKRLGNMNESRRGSIPCPHCRGAMRVRSNRAITDLCRDLYLQCGNIDCSATYRGQLTIVNGIQPSLTPRQGIDLRMNPPRPRAAPANDRYPPVITSASGSEVPPAANDDDADGSAVG